MPWHFAVIDPDTPQSAYSKRSWVDSSVELELVFSDEFNVEGRTFYPGDDPYWEAVDLHYWATNNLEWYDPQAITTQGGNLVITLEQKMTHNLSYQGGMMSTWNKFCFTGGYIEANVSLPGLHNVAGLWPAVWTMGNLGRAGYGASLEGMVRTSITIVVHVVLRVLPSGHIPMIRVTLGRLPTNPSTANLTMRRLTATKAMAVSFPSFLDRNCQDALAQMSTPMER